MTDASNLDELLDEWRSRYAALEEAGFTAEYVTLEECIDDLEAVMEEDDGTGE